jgi:hypothetical protein
LEIIRKFLEFASKHTVEELQSFTKAKVPVPSWVDKKSIVIAETHIDKAATVLRQHLQETESLDVVGGPRWWTVRDSELQGEWIEMAKDRLKRIARRKQAAESGIEADPDRVIYYIHGGA